MLHYIISSQHSSQRQRQLVRISIVRSPFRSSSSGRFYSIIPRTRRKRDKAETATRYAFLLATANTITEERREGRGGTRFFFPSPRVPPFFLLIFALEESTEESRIREKKKKKKEKIRITVSSARALNTSKTNTFVEQFVARIEFVLRCFFSSLTRARERSSNAQLLGTSRGKTHSSVSIYLRTPPSHYCTESETRENRSPPCFFVFSPSSSVFRLRSDLTALIIWRGGGRGSLSSKIIKLNRGVHRDRRRWIVAKVRREVRENGWENFGKVEGKTRGSFSIV